MTVSRRLFLTLIGVSSGALAIGAAFRLSAAGAPAAAPDPDSFVRIGSDNTVTVVVKHLEMGQGVSTGLTTIVAEELDADWSQMRVEFAPAEVPRYANRLVGFQLTGGSNSILNSWDELRNAAAAARQMLISAAARHWRLPAEEFTIEKGVIRHPPTGRQADFASFAGMAAALPVPTEVRLKAAAEFKLIGSPLPRRMDSADKVAGVGGFGLDQRPQGLLRAVIARSPRFGGRLKSFDAAAARAVPGVVGVVQVPSGVAVVARDTWSAIKGREALRLEWDDQAAEMRSSDAILADYKALAATPGLIAADRGDATQALASAAKVVEAEYSFPYLAHAPMEPLNATIQVTRSGAEIWTGSQMQTGDQAAAAAVLGLAPAKVKIHTLWAGGSFGRRANAGSDYIAEAAAVAKAFGGSAPIQLVWTREDDIQGGRYRPMAFHRLTAGLDGDGRLVAWRHVLVSQSIIAGTPFEKFMIKDGIDATSVEGAADLPYAVANLRVEVHNAASPLPVLWWRSVGHSINAFAVECFLDEVAAAAGRDPLAFRLDLLADRPDHAAVLKLAAERAGWDKPMPAGHGRGIAVHGSFSSLVAEVAEVSLGADGKPKVERVVTAVDCGTAINPDQVAAQMEGGIGFALGAMLRGAITLADGIVRQSNFTDYEPLRMSEMPVVETHILPSEAHPTGVGEPGVPPLAPAVANAMAAAGSARVRRLPLSEA
ncbi:MAG TPA: xanthine dehydrogenase family protein molybdopterin-binding subunit [Rhodospirillaceae bacterium]|nr:xanthine dehydrogenase family protein molybdopterin-binding subunit [Rhodospirillaceae bacterium]